MRASFAVGWIAGALLFGSGTVAAAPPTVVPVDLGEGETLSLTLPAFPGLARDEASETGDCKACWKASLSSGTLALRVLSLSRDALTLHQPADVVRWAEGRRKDPAKGGDAKFDWTVRETVKGPFGWYETAALAWGPWPNEARAQGEEIVLGGILPGRAYAVVAETKPRLGVTARMQVLQTLKRGVEAKVTVSETDWTTAEEKERWQADVADAKTRTQLKGPVRTKHYLLFSNSGAGALFAKKMEDCYALIRDVYPFPEVEGRRRMPVFVFQQKPEYVAFCMHVSGWSEDEAKATKGYAAKDYYATYYDSPNDPVHIHEATHQLMRNRLGLSGGGSWFQEGIAEYMAWKPSERESFSHQMAASRKFIPFADLARMDQLISGTGTYSGRFAYQEAASIVAFLREGDWHPDRFLTFVHAVGRVRWGDVDGVASALKAVYGTDLAGMEQAFVKYWSAR